MKPIVVVATRNDKKRREIKRLLRGTGVRLFSLRSYPKVPEIIEDGKTFAENARKKALIVSRLTGRVAVADDSGLEVDSLEGRPGVYSARFAGKKAVDRDNNRKLLRLLAGKPTANRKARFVCVIAVARPDGRVRTVTGNCRGSIGEACRGKYGFGYDPVFIAPGYGGRTFAELGAVIKNRISHRARALKKAGPLIAAAAEEWARQEGS